MYREKSLQKTVSAFRYFLWIIPFILLVLRWRNPDPDLFNRNSYCYHAIATNNNEIEPMEWLEIHNGRMNSENYNKEVKTGFNVDYTPSNDFTMNENYFLTGILAYNMIQIMKLFYLGKNTIKEGMQALEKCFLANGVSRILGMSSSETTIANFDGKGFVIPSPIYPGKSRNIHSLKLQMIKNETTIIVEINRQHKFYLVYNVSKDDEKEIPETSGFPD